MRRSSPESGPAQSEAPPVVAKRAKRKTRPKRAKRKSVRDYIFSIPGAVVAICGGIAAVYGLWTQLRPELVGPRLVLTLTQCLPNHITLDVQNDGGQTARVDAPVFTRYVNGVEDSLPISEIVGQEKFQDANRRIAPGNGYPLDYQSSDVPFFRDEWWRGRPCPIRVRMMLHNGDGAGQIREASCPCAQLR